MMTMSRTVLQHRMGLESSLETIQFLSLRRFTVILARLRLFATMSLETGGLLLASQKNLIQPSGRRGHHFLWNGIELEKFGCTHSTPTSTLTRMGSCQCGMSTTLSVLDLIRDSA